MIGDREPGSCVEATPVGSDPVPDRSRHHGHSTATSTSRGSDPTGFTNAGNPSPKSTQAALNRHREPA